MSSSSDDSSGEETVEVEADNCLIEVPVKVFYGKQLLIEYKLDRLDLSFTAETVKRDILNTQNVKHQPQDCKLYFVNDVNNSREMVMDSDTLETFRSKLYLDSHIEVVASVISDGNNVDEVDENVKAGVHTVDTA